MNVFDKISGMKNIESKAAYKERIDALKKELNDAVNTITDIRRHL